MMDLLRRRFVLRRLAGLTLSAVRTWSVLFFPAGNHLFKYRCHLGGNGPVDVTAAEIPVAVAHRLGSDPQKGAQRIDSLMAGIYQSQLEVGRLMGNNEIHLVPRALQTGALRRSAPQRREAPAATS